MKVERLFVSPGHNFFGHHGEPAGGHPAVEVESVECVAGRGLRGDRFFDYKENYQGQITFFSREIFERLVAAVGAPDVSPAAVRRNVLVSGADLGGLVGHEFELQDIRFQGAAECSPCYWMDAAVGAGAEAFLRGQGGLRARILTSGTLRRES